MQEFVDKLKQLRTKARVEQTDNPWDRNPNRAIWIATAIGLLIVLFFTALIQGLNGAFNGQPEKYLRIGFIYVMYASSAPIWLDRLLMCPLTIGSEVRLYAILKAMPRDEYESFRKQARSFEAHKVLSQTNNESLKLIRKYIIKKDIQR